jgi:hypothetical protein
MSGHYLLVSLGYACLTMAVGVFEARRMRANGPDAVSAFIVLFLVQCCVPGIVIYACLPLVDASHPTDVGAFDRIFASTDLSAALLVLGLTAWFVLFFYAFTALNGRLLRRFLRTPASSSLLVLSGSIPLLLVVLTFGLALSLASFYVLGSSLTERFANLILFRAGAEKIEGSLLNAYGFALTQTWAWLSVPALFVIFERRGRRLAWFLCLGFLAVFVLLGVSRRALFIPAILIYLTLVLYDHRWRPKWLLAAAIPLLMWIAFGKELIGIVAFGGTLSDVTERYETISASFLRAASEIGITVVESLGSISLLDLPPRFGVDHLLSVLRQIPTSHSWLGDLPARMVRLSTEAFATPYDEDIPPGLLGQMWMDFRVLGPIVWAFMLSLQMSIVQHVFAQTVRTRQAVALLMLVTFVVALPLNTGTYDFTFSIDVYVLILCILLTFRFTRVRVPTADAGLTSAVARVTSRPAR